jgi:ketosteroid isomerase-like protein
MSQENVDTFKRTAEAYRRRDIEAMLAELDPEVEWHPGLPAFLGGEATVYRGHDGIRELVRDLDEHFSEFNNEYSEIRDLGDQVLAFGHIRARGKASGAETVSPLAFLVESKDGKAIRVRTYLDPKDALEAAGLRE